MAQDKWTPEAFARALINPHCCLTRPPVVPEEQWIAANVKLIRDMEEETYLTNLFHAL